uniref:Uncharacterized protein n=1 Tax=Acrobeloides nanus TaxID=290746 RepID=A0A914EGM8_9BILA
MALYSKNWLYLVVLGACSVVQLVRSNTTISFSNIQISCLRGDFLSTNGASASADVAFQTVTSQINTPVPLIGNWTLVTNAPPSITQSIPNTSVQLADPTHYINVGLTITLSFLPPKSPQTISSPGSIISISESTWVTANPQTVSTNFSSTVQDSIWSITVTYVKFCNDSNMYGFNCNITCDPPSTGYCYNCNPITGERDCCTNYTIADPQSCRINGTPIPVTSSTATTALTTTSTGNVGGGTCISEKELDDTRKDKKIFMWIMIALGILCLILLLLLIFCCFRAQHYKEEAQTYRLRQYSARQNSPRPQIVHENPAMVSRDPSNRASTLDQPRAQQRREPPPYLYRPAPTRPAQAPPTGNPPVPPARSGSYHIATDRPAYEHVIL